MNNKTDHHRQKLQHFANESQSTHNIAAQATAARLLLLLESRYAAFLGAGEPSMEEQKALDASVEAYLNGLVPELMNPHPVTQMLSIIWALDVELADKIICLNEFRALINKHPASDDWTMNDAQWCLNSFYNADKDSHEQVQASPAKTLALVCAAILDNNNHECSELVNQPTSSSSVQAPSEAAHTQGIQDRAKNLLSCMLRLQQGEEREKCSGGRQHDLLWLLQGSYLDAQGKLFTFVESLPVFLTQLATNFVQIQFLPLLSQKQRMTLMTDWLNYSTTDEPMTNPLLSLLEQYYPDRGLTACQNWMNEACAGVGISPQQVTEQINSTAENLAEIGIPLDNPTQMQRLLELCRTSPLMQAVPHLQRLTQARNRVMIAFKASALSYSPDALTTIQANSANLYTAETIFQSLCRYSTMLLIGSEDKCMQDACLPMIAALEDYFNHYFIDPAFNQSFEAIKTDYLMQEQQFKEQSHEGVVTTFFQAIKTNPEDFESYWSRIKCIPDLQLSDANIKQLMNAHLIETYITIEEGSENQPQRTTLTVVTALSTYDINRLLLHGLFIKPALWSTTYKQTLQSVCIWFLSPPAEHDSPDLLIVREGFNSHLLANMLMSTLLTEKLRNYLPSHYENALGFLFSHFIKEYFRYINHDPRIKRKLFSTLSPFFNVLVRDGSDLCYLLEQAPNLTGQIQLWDAVKNNLPIIIEDSDQLLNLFRLSLKQLNTTQRLELWEAVKLEMPYLTQWSPSISHLFELTDEQFNASARIELLDIIKEELPDLIEDFHNFNGFFGLSSEKFNAQHRGRVWEAIKTKLPVIISEFYELKYIIKYSLEQLNADFRQELWEAIETRLPEILRDPSKRSGFCDLSLFFSLPLELFNAEQRQILWNAAPKKLISKIELPEFIQLVKLSEEQFTIEQRCELWTVINQKHPLEKRKKIEKKYSSDSLISTQGLFSPTKAASSRGDNADVPRPDHYP